MYVNTCCGNKKVIKKKQLYRSTKITTDISIDYRWTLDRNIERLSSDYRPSVDRPSTECWPITDWYIGQESTNYWRSVREKSAKCWWSIGVRKAISAEIQLERLSTDYQPCLDRVSTDYRRLYRPSVDRLSTAISTDRSVDTTYSKHTIDCDLGTRLGILGIFGNYESDTTNCSNNINIKKPSRIIITIISLYNPHKMTMSLNFPGIRFLRTKFKSRKRKNWTRRLVVTSSIRRRTREFHAVVVQWRQRNPGVVNR